MSMKDIISYCDKTFTKTNKNLPSTIKVLKAVIKQEWRMKQMTI